MIISKENLIKIKAALREDSGKGDITTRLLIPAQAKARSVILAREGGLFCGGYVAEAVFKVADSKLKIKRLVSEGAPIKKDQAVLAISGGVHGILKGERTALNFLGHLTGIATKTRLFSDKVKKYGTVILDTRKTTPLWRGLEKYAVKTGGGKNHRMGLFDAVFVKENHRLQGSLKNLRKVAGNFEIEVRNLRELSESLMLKPKVILFDNFKPSELKTAVKIARKTNPRIILEASGGITEKNIQKFAAAGVDQISVGALTHSVRCFDFSLLVKK